MRNHSRSRRMIPTCPCLLAAAFFAATTLFFVVHAKNVATTQRPIHAAFVAPPLSHYTCMLPIAHALLDAGHTVTFIGYEGTVDKIRELYDRRPDARALSEDGRLHFRVLTRKTDDAPKVSKDAIVSRIQSLPYWGAQLFSAYSLPILHNKILSTKLALQIRARADEILLLDSPPGERVDVLSFFALSPSLYGMAEALEIPAVGINGLAGYSALGDLHVDPPWTVRPNFAMFVRDEEMWEGTPTTILARMGWNLFVRIVGFVFLTIGSVMNSIDRYHLGHHSPFELLEYSFVERHPMITPYLTEFMLRSPSLTPLHAYNIGIVDHPAMGGNTMRKSQDADAVIEWLDSHCEGSGGSDAAEASSSQDDEKCNPVYYFTLGTEVLMTEDMARFFAEAFRSAELSVLWANKVDPRDAVGEDFPSESVFYTEFAPQIAVLSHPAVIGFFSHGGFNSLSEAIVREVPLVIMPFFGDQMGNAMEVQALGNGLALRKDLIWSYTSKKKEGIDCSEELDAVKQAMEAIAGPTFQKRARFLSEVNARRQNIGLAVEVFEFAARREFKFHRPRPPNLILRYCPFMQCLILLWGVRIILKGLFSRRTRMIPVAKEKLS